MIDELGVYWYIGCQGIGKTTIALEDLAGEISRSRKPALVVDSEGVEQLESVPHVGSRRDGILRVWQEKTHAAYTPFDEEDLEQLLAAVHAGKDVHLFVDEASYWLNSSYLSPELSRLMRAYRHARVSVQLTTQQLRDIPRRALGIYTELYIFQHFEPGDLERLEKEYGLDPQLVSNLQWGERITIRKGRVVSMPDRRPVPAPDPAPVPTPAPAAPPQEAAA